MKLPASSSRSILVSGKHEINPSEPGDCTTENEKDASYDRYRIPENRR